MRHERRQDPAAPASGALSPDQMAAYVASLRLHNATTEELADSLDVSIDRASRALSELLSLGMVDEKSGTYVARHPAGAFSRLVADKFDRIVHESREIDRILGSIEDLTRSYDAGRQYRTREFPVEVVQGSQELFDRVGEIACHGPLGVDFAVPDQRTLIDYVEDEALLGRWLDAVREGGLRLRALVAVESLRVPDIVRMLGRVIEAGAQIRTLPRLPGWFGVYGPGAATLPVEWGTTFAEQGYSCYLVRSPVVVGACRDLFEELWNRATPIPGGGEDNGARMVLRLAAQGISDEMIARHLRVSVRTVRSRFADAMAELGAQTRFQAGVEAARRGWLM
ncbi:helix-turn-helix transcriptional regulator [Bailinhaonella thermotolerans]|uniref:LuxR family transcriptional regulator n=1 Tax=Bailinhaonella thermotolerans TaxID=1070861 RepID=A0A3A4AC49_9ACTN|nr:LuxR C-terminal-related transcriptional regulator [Bailinhaonella thermotolerans]RJL23600.1 LuxR family transcriptional regulator [Bailinhaonella thermotolerans]